MVAAIKDDSTLYRPPSHDAGASFVRVLSRWRPTPHSFAVEVMNGDGALTRVSAVMNVHNPLATKSATWGHVEALYRTP